jgi:hypothetical protein
MTFMRMLAAFTVIAVLASTHTFGATNTAGKTNGVSPFDDLKGQYEKAVTQIEGTDHGKAQDALVAYGKGLDATLASIQKQGNLDALLLVQAEKRRFDSEKTVPDVTGEAERAGIDRLAGDYKKAVDYAHASRAKAMLALNQRYEPLLVGLVKKLVQADEIEQATKVNEELKRIRSEIEGASAELRAATEARPSKGTAAAPGPKRGLPMASRKGPAGEGTLAFGGVNWTPWRTLFEVQGDRLVSLPKVRPGFNYGHGGNGRSATLMTNIGNADWKDYSVEFEFGMSGMDPAFNPYGLPTSFRSVSIMFHVADATESWNDPGWSWYGLGLQSDGSWSLGSTYNFYCPSPSGYSSPRTDGGRTLAEGKGLTFDPENGNKIRIDVIKTRIQIWVDGKQIVDVRDEKMGERLGDQTLDHGGIGISWGFESMGWISKFSGKRL